MNYIKILVFNYFILIISFCFFSFSAIAQAVEEPCATNVVYENEVFEQTQILNKISGLPSSVQEEEKINFMSSKLTKYENLLTGRLIDRDQTLDLIIQLLNNFTLGVYDNNVHKIMKQADKVVGAFVTFEEVISNRILREKIYSLPYQTYGRFFIEVQTYEDFTNDMNVKFFGRRGSSGYLRVDKYEKYLHHGETEVENGYWINDNPIVEAATPKIPRIMHHIWLTDEKSKREIFAEDIENVLNTHKILLQSGKEWEHIVWTNDKNLIPASVSKLEANGIKVKEISEVESSLQLGKNIRDLIKSRAWGMASDILRYELINHLGGVYVDLNFVLHDNAGQLLEEAIYKFDFYSPNTENYSLCARKNHPILFLTLKAIDRQFNHPPIFFIPDLLKTVDVNGKINIDKLSWGADAVTYDIYCVILSLASNINGNIDMWGGRFSYGKDKIVCSSWQERCQNKR